MQDGECTVKVYGSGAEGNCVRKIPPARRETGVESV